MAFLFRKIRALLDDGEPMVLKTAEPHVRSAPRAS